MNSDVSSEHEEEIVRLLVNRGVDGLMLVTAHEIDADEQLVESLASLPVPFGDGGPFYRGRELR